MIADPQVRKEFKRMVGACAFVVGGFLVWDLFSNRQVVVAEIEPEILEEVDNEHHPAPSEI